MSGDDRNRRDGSRGAGGSKPGKGGKGGKGPTTGSRGRTDRARRADDQGRGGKPGGGRGRPDERRNDRGAGSDRGGQGDRPERGPRPPIKGKRRVFDEDSAPNERERARSDREGSGEREQWIDEGPVRKAAGDAVRRGGRPDKRGRPTGNGRARPDGSKPGKGKGGKGRADRDAAGKGAAGKGTATNRRRAQRAAKRAESVMEIDRARLEKRLGASRAERTVKRLGEATAAFAEERYEDARKTLKPIVELIPEEPAVRELHGLCLYRLGRWRQAVGELEEFARRTGSTEQHPVLADCYRALGQHARVEELWDEIGEASLAAPLVAEGRIVMAGSLADRGRVVDAIGVLEGGALGSSELKDHHLRMRYVLGDLYDRAGDHQAARRYFESVDAAAPGFFDVRDRLQQL